MNPLKMLQDLLAHTDPGERKLPTGEGRADRFGVHLEEAEKDLTEGKRPEVNPLALPPTGPLAAGVVPPPAAHPGGKESLPSAAAAVRPGLAAPSASRGRTPPGGAAFRTDDAGSPTREALARIQLQGLPGLSHQARETRARQGLADLGLQGMERVPNQGLPAQGLRARGPSPQAQPGTFALPEGFEIASAPSGRPGLTLPKKGMPFAPTASAVARQNPTALADDTIRLDRTTGTVQVKLGDGSETVSLPTPLLSSSHDRKDGARQVQEAPKPEVPRRAAPQESPAAKRETEPAVVAHGHGGSRSAPPPADAVEKVAPAMPVPVPEEAFDPGLHLRFVPGGARMALQTPGSGDLTVQLDVREGVADLKVGGQAAWLIGAHTEELRVALAQEGLTLGKLDPGDAGFGPGGERPPSSQGERGDDGRDAPRPSPGETTLPTSPQQRVARPTGTGRHHVEA